jgi:hypothetical protein
MIAIRLRASHELFRVFISYVEGQATGTNPPFMEGR